MASRFILTILLGMAAAQFQDQQFSDQLLPNQAAEVMFPSNGQTLAYVLPSGYETLVTNLQTTFSCENRPFGYYADVDNECRVFHVCNPIMTEDGQEVSVDQFSFICGNQTIFSQEALTCDYIDVASPCQDAPNLYEVVNAEFFRLNPEGDQSFDNQGKSFDNFHQESQQAEISQGEWVN